MAQSEHRGRENLRGGESLSTQRRRRKKRRTSAGTVLFWLVIMIALSCSLAVFVLHSANDIFGLNKADQQYEITIEEGLSPHQIAQILADKGVIDQPLTFRFYSSVRNRNGVFQAGRYVLNSNMSYDQIVIALRTGNTIKEEVTLTFYEGMSASGIAKMLEEKKVCKAEEFLERLKTVEFGYEFENMLPESSLRFRRLEGYLFPDTYDFYVGEKVDSVLKKFMSNFQIRVFPKLYNEILDAGMTLDEAITLASIVQKEAGDPKEMARVSSVFHNRMSNTSAGLP
ncbi:MAG: endolytic transglycosylase MltG, partial [Oscillospiraceae bacterium]